MKENTVYLQECGGGLGCTEKLHMSIVDFALVLNGKHYRFGMTDGNLSILCINGVDEKIGVKNGYKNLVITNSSKEWDSHSESRQQYLEAIKIAKEEGCVNCPFRVDNAVYKMCSQTGEDFRTHVPERGHSCPFVD